MQQATQGRSVLVQGRIVWTNGDLFAGKAKLDYNTKAPKLNAQGEPLREYGFGLAVPKSVLGQAGPGQPGEIWAAIHEEAFTLFPSRQIPPAFAMKFKDGDGIDDKGQPFAQREGYAGHLIFACTTTLPIKFFKWENGQNIMVNEGIKCGDYVNVQLHIKAHPAVGAGKAGLYLNPNAVQFLGYGKEIVNAPSGDQIFGNQAPPVPQGASAMPLAPQPGQMLVPQAAPQQPTQTAYAPNHGVLPPQHQPAPMPAPQAAAPTYPQAVAPVMPAPTAYQPQQTVAPAAYPQAAPVPQGQGFPQYPTPR